MKNILDETARFILNEIQTVPLAKQPIFTETDILLPNEDIVKSSEFLVGNFKAVIRPRWKSDEIVTTEKSFPIPARRMTLSRQNTPLRKQGGGEERMSNYMARRKELRESLKMRKREERHSTLIKKLNPKERPSKLGDSIKSNEGNKSNLNISSSPDFLFMTPKKQMVTGYISTPQRYRQVYLEELQKTQNPKDTPSRIIDAWLKVKSNKTPVRPSRRGESGIPFPQGMKVYYGKQSVRIKSRRFRSIDERRIERKLKKKK